LYPTRGRGLPLHRDRRVPCLLRLRSGPEQYHRRESA
jgi:hypothetical protein